MKLVENFQLKMSRSNQKMKINILLITICVFIIQVIAGNEVNKLTGVVIIKKAYGAPNYGETPNLDTIEYYPVLKLDRPHSFSLEKNECEIKEIQLIFLTDDLNMSNLDGQRVSVNGKIEMANSGHHHELYYIVISNQSQVTFLNRKNDLGK